jgi:murein DD-endopeptidase MepM/ murein hydrolase activator NlpD
MKQSKDYKIAYKNIFSFIIFSVFLSVPLFFSFAQNTDIVNRINEKSADIERIEREIKAYQQELNSLGQQSKTLSSTIKELDLTRKKLNADISLSQKKIDRANIKIQELGLGIGDKEQKIAFNTTAIIRAIKETNELENNSIMQVILSGEKFSSIWEKIDNMMTVKESLNQNIKDLHMVKTELEDNREETITAKKELEDLKNKLADQKKIVDQNVIEKNKILKATKNSEASYQKLVAEQTAKKIAIEQEIRDYESQLKYNLDPNQLPGGRVLSWPLDNIFVTQLFGKTVDSKRLYASGSHSGVDFRASVGTPVKSMADGVVVGFGDTDASCPNASFGKWILVNHQNGLATAYGHLSLIKVSKGQKISRGELIGYSGATGRVTGPHLHVTVYAGGAVVINTIPSKSCPGKTLTQPMAATSAYLDPMTYLPIYKQ